MTITAVLDRVYACNLEIGNITKVLRLPPPKLVKNADLPLLYAVPVGYQNEQFASTDSLNRIYRIDLELLVRPADRDNLTTGGVSNAFTLTEGHVNTIETYYSTHRMLKTSTTGSNTPLSFLLAPGITFGADFQVMPPMRSTADGELYMGAVFTLLIPLNIENEPQF